MESWFSGLFTMCERERSYAEHKNPPVGMDAASTPLVSGVHVTGGTSPAASFAQADSSIHAPFMPSKDDDSKNDITKLTKMTIKELSEEKNFLVDQLKTQKYVRLSTSLPSPP